MFLIKLGAVVLVGCVLGCVLDDITDKIETKANKEKEDSNRK